MKKESTERPAKETGEGQRQYKAHGPGQRPPRSSRYKQGAYPDRRIAGLKHEPKLTVEQVDAIRRDYRPYSRDANMRILAERHKVSISTIYKVIHEERWRFDDWRFRPRAKRANQVTLFRALTKRARVAMINTALAFQALAPDAPDVQAIIRRYAHLLEAPG